MSSKPLSGKTALVTGGSRGIGRAIAERLAADGALVAITYRSNTAEADATVAAINNAGGVAFAIKGDVGKLADVERSVASLRTELRSRTKGERLDILVTNAGVAPFVSLEDTTEAIFEDLVSTNIKGTFYWVQKAVPLMGEGGRIITLSSAVTRIHFAGIPAYSATKGFVDTLTLHLAGELGARGITVNAIAPGVIESDMTAGMLSQDGMVEGVKSMQALKRIGQPADIARVAAFLAGPDGAWVTAQVIEASGGIKL